MKCPQCPYYEQKTSYGTEIIKCNNEECQHKMIEPQKISDRNMKMREELFKAERGDKE